MEAITKQLSKLPQQLQAVQSSTNQGQTMKCDFCGGDHPNGQCSFQGNPSQEEVQYMGNQGRQGDFSGNYQNNASQGWRNNQSQSFGWKQDAGPSNTPYHQQQFPSTQDRTTKLEDTLEKFMQASMVNQKNTEASIRNLETQVGQLAKQLADQQGSQFLANTQTNPREYCKSITTRSGKVVGEGIGDNLNVEESGVEEEKNESEGEKEKNREESGRSEKKSEKHKKGESQMRSPL